MSDPVFLPGGHEKRRKMTPRERREARRAIGLFMDIHFNRRVELVNHLFPEPGAIQSYRETWYDRSDAGDFWSRLDLANRLRTIDFAVDWYGVEEDEES